MDKLFPLNWCDNRDFSEPPAEYRKIEQTRPIGSKSSVHAPVNSEGSGNNNLTNRSQDGKDLSTETAVASNDMAQRSSGTLLDRSAHLTTEHRNMQQRIDELEMKLEQKTRALDEFKIEIQKHLSELESRITPGAPQNTADSKLEEGISKETIRIPTVWGGPIMPSDDQNLWFSACEVTRQIASSIFHSPQT